MSYHVGNLGVYAGDRTHSACPAYYADIDGFAPEPGDSSDMFCYGTSSLESSDPGSVDYWPGSGVPGEPVYGPDGLDWDAWVGAAYAAYQSRESIS